MSEELPEQLAEEGRIHGRGGIKPVGIIKARGCHVTMWIEEEGGRKKYILRNICLTHVTVILAGQSGASFAANKTARVTGGRQIR